MTTDVETATVAPATQDGAKPSALKKGRKFMWSLVIAKDLFSAFDPDNLLDPVVAARYRDAVLVPGGSRDAADLVADFLGRPYDTEAFEAWLNR